MAGYSDAVIAQALGVPLGQHGLSPAVKSWGPVLAQQNAAEIIYAAVLKQYQIDLKSMIDGPLLIEFVTDVLKGAQHVHNEFGVSFNGLGFTKEAKTYDGHPAEAIYKPESNLVYVAASTVRKYQEQRDKEKQGKGELVGTANLPGLAFPSRESPLILGLEEALHAVDQLQPGRLPKDGAIPMAQGEFEPPPAEALAHAAREDEKAISAALYKYVQELKLGPYNPGRAKG
jgi:hypothetical protein